MLLISRSNFGTPLRTHFVQPLARAAHRIMAVTASRNSLSTVASADEVKLKPFRLRKVGKWSDAAPYLASIAFRFDPSLDGTSGCKELWRQSKSKKIRSLHPKYTVSMELNDSGIPGAVDVKYSDGVVVKIAAQGKAVSDLLDEIIAPTEAMQDKEDAIELEKN